VQRGAADARGDGAAARIPLGLPDGPAWLWLLFVAPAIQVVAHADKVLELSDWLKRALLQWRDVTHALWRDLFGWLQITLPFDEYELDGLTLGALCAGAALTSLVRGSRAPLQADVVRAYEMSASSRLILFSVVGVVAFAYFMTFFGANGIYLYGDLEVAGLTLQTILIGGAALGAVAFALLLYIGAPFFQKVRIELALAVLMFVVGAVVLLGMALVLGFDDVTAYLEYRGLNWASYMLIVAAIAAAIACVLFVNWRALPAIMVVAVAAIAADRVVQFLAPVADYLNSLLT
jgi:hypothetical protein